MESLQALKQLGFGEYVEDAIAELYAMQIVQTRMNTQFQNMRKELGTVQEQVKNLQIFHRLMLERGKEWQMEQTRLVNLVCDLRSKEQLLQASIHTLVTEWLTPEQQASIKHDDNAFTKNKRTLERKNEPDRRSIE